MKNRTPTDERECDAIIEFHPIDTVRPPISTRTRTPAQTGLPAFYDFVIKKSYVIQKIVRAIV